MAMPQQLPGFAGDLKAHLARLEAQNAHRDAVHHLIHQVREGNIRQLFPSELDFSISFNGSPIANFVDIVARDMAEGIAPLPALACVSGKMITEADLKRAEMKNRIGDNYWQHSNLENTMLSGADLYITYGFLPFFIEPDLDEKLPFIHLEDPRNSYYELDRFGRCVVYAHKWRRSIDDLCAEFPEYESVIRSDNDKGATEIDLVRWVDKTNVTLFLPARQGAVLVRYEHKMSCTPVVIAQRPGISKTPRGQFDDVIWVQVARSIMSTLALEAASLAVQAPIAIPDDVDQLSVGPHALMQSKNAKDIHRVDIGLPNQIFAEGQVLDQELRTGARYPEARSGTPGTSVITGKGVEALLGSFDSQIKGAQLVMKDALQRATAACFEMDEAWWPKEAHTVSGTISGTSYEFSYTPAKDINGRYHCTVTYGFAAGLAPAQSIVTMLQLEGAGLIAKGTTMENLPFSIDQVQEARKINVEQSREALKQGVFALVQSSGQMAAQGQDPMPIIQLSVNMINAIENGATVEDAVQGAFTQMQQAQQQAQQAAQAQQAQQAQDQGADQGGAPGGPPDGGDGMPQGVAPGQAGMPAGGRPSLEQMISGFRGGGNVPVLQNEIRRSVPIGTQ